MKHLLLAITALLFSTLFSFAQQTEIKELQAKLSHPPDSLGYTDALNKIARLYYETNADSILTYATKARDVARRLGYAKGVADAAINLGSLDEIRGDAQEAFRYYFDAYDQYSTIGDQGNMMLSMMNIAQVYSETEKPEKCLFYFRKAFALSRGVRQDSMVAVLYANYVSCFYNQLSQDSIKYYLRKARGISEKYKDKATMLFTDQLRAQMLITKQDKEQAIGILKPALQSALQDSLFLSVAGMLVDLGNAVADSAEASDYYLQSLTLAQAKGFRIIARYAYEQLYDFYQARNDDSSSLAYAQKLLDFYNTQKDIDNASGIDYIDYALVNQRLSASLLSSRYQEHILWLTIAICVLFFMLIVLLLHNRRRMRMTATALKTQFQQSKITMESLDKINRDYSRVIKVVAHDLRNPISSISMISEIIDPYNMPAKEIEKLAKIINTTSKSCFDLIEQLLTADLDQHIKLDEKEVVLDDLLRRSIELLNFKAKEKKQQIVVSNKLHMILFVDDDKMMRVLMNLITNAIKFSHEGSTIHVRTFPAANNVVITVTDKGIGIPKAMENRIFDPFTSVRRKGTNGENTFGLGLYITKQIVEAHGGSIWFKSEPENGTTFYVELPVKSSSSHRLDLSGFSESKGSV